MNSDSQKQLVELLELQSDGHLDDVAKQQLSNLLRDNPDGMRIYVEHCQIHSMLAWEHGGLAELRLDESTSPPPSPSRLSMVGSLAKQWHWLATAAAILLAVSLGWLNWHKLSPEKAVAGRLPHHWEKRERVGSFAKSLGAELFISGGQYEAKVGDSLRVGEYEVKNGYVEIALLHGVDVIVESPAKFEIKDSLRIVLAHGLLSARVPESGHDFTVETPSTEVVDHGTEFAVEVDVDHSSEVHVFQGEVEVRPKSPAARVATLYDLPRAVRLVSNQATRFRNAASEPESIAVDPDRFVRDLEEPSFAYSRVVRSFKPDVYLRMAPNEKGNELPNKGRGKQTAFVERGKMLRPPFAPGRYGVGLRLGGPDSQAYASLPNFETSSDGELTVCVWVRADSRPSWASIIKNWSKGDGGQFRFGLFREDGDLEIRVRQRDGKAVQIRENTPLPLGEWQHVAFVVSSETLSLYRNSRLVGQMACRGLASLPPRSLGIGAKLNEAGTGPALTSTGFWHGRMDELVIYQRALTAEQILKIFESSRD